MLAQQGLGSRARQPFLVRHKEPYGPLFPACVPSHRANAEHRSRSSPRTPISHLRPLLCGDLYISICTFRVISYIENTVNCKPCQEVEAHTLPRYCSKLVLELRDDPEHRPYTHAALLECLAGKVKYDKSACAAYQPTGGSLISTAHNECCRWQKEKEHHSLLHQARVLGLQLAKDAPRKALLMFTMAHWTSGRVHSAGTCQTWANEIANAAARYALSQAGGFPQLSSSLQVHKFVEAIVGKDALSKDRRIMAYLTATGKSAPKRSST